MQSAGDGTDLVEANLDGSVGPPSISADGSRVAFSSDAGNLIPNDTNAERTDPFVRDLNTGETMAADSLPEGGVALNQVQRSFNGLRQLTAEYQSHLGPVLTALTPAVRYAYTEMAGGGFGRRATADSHVQREAAEIAKRVRGTPVKLIWSREDDVRGGYYRPMNLHRVEVGIGADGMPAAWRHVIVGQSILAETPFAVMMKDNIDPTAVEGVNDTHYAIPNFHVSSHNPKVNVPVLWWRSVGHTHSAFVMETLVDELAARARVDPFAYRRRLLKPEAKKLRAALDLLEARSAAWRRGLPRGHAVGIACHESFETGVACAVDVSIENKRPRIHRAMVAVDCGLAVNPLTVESRSLRSRANTRCGGDALKRNCCQRSRNSESGWLHLVLWIKASSRERSTRRRSSTAPTSATSSLALRRRLGRRIWPWSICCAKSQNGRRRHPLR